MVVHFFKGNAHFVGGVFSSHELGPVQLNMRCRQFVRETLPWVWHCLKNKQYLILPFRRLTISQTDKQVHW